MKTSKSQRKMQVDKAKRQCELLSLPRSSYYHKAVGESAGNLS